ncbi:MAG: hypothetical protein KGJ90_05915 [Patescibacteria group bacterium]|nr:hypothetical protein [Patescibacteria group bacterium]
MADQLSIINRALLKSGSRSQISSLNEGSTESDVANVLFTPTFESLGRTANWNCLRKQVTLTLIAAAAGTPENPNGTTIALPPSPWLYSYEVPSDCLRARFIIPTYSSTVGVVPELTTASNITTPYLNNIQIPFILAYGVDAFGNPNQIILTNQTQAQLVYTVNQPNPTIWDSHFQEAMVTSLAVYFIQALNSNIPLMQNMAKSANEMIANARMSDGNEGTTSQSRDASWVTARLGRYFPYNAPYSYNYENMPFPIM